MICTDHNLIEDSKEYHNKYFLYDKNTNSTFSDLLEIDILELKKVPDKDESNLATWLRFMNTDDKEELNKMAVRNAALESAVCKYKKLTADERIRMIAEESEKAWKDRQAEIKAAKEEGLEQGLEQGEEKGRNEREIEIARKMLMKNKDISEIMEFTDLSEEEIQKLR